MSEAFFMCLRQNPVGRPAGSLTKYTLLIKSIPAGKARKQALGASVNQGIAGTGYNQEEIKNETQKSIGNRRRRLHRLPSM